jgi:hypothetical protein
MANPAKGLLGELIDSVEQDIRALELHLESIRKAVNGDPNFMSKDSSSLRKAHLQYRVLLSVLKEEEKAI